MKNKLLKFSMLSFSLVLISFMTSCSKESQSNETEIASFVEEVESDVQLQTRSGSGNCFELVWPLTIILPDGSTSEVNDKDELKTVAKSWKEDHPDIPGRVKVQFPIEVISEGEIVTVESISELRQLRRQCIDRPNLSDKRPCFRLVFPVSITYPNGEVVEYEYRKGLKLALRKWKINHPNATVKPQLLYPLTIKMKDGTEVIVQSKEELQQIKEDCNG